MAVYFRFFFSFVFYLRLSLSRSSSSGLRKIRISLGAASCGRVTRIMSIGVFLFSILLSRQRLTSLLLQLHSRYFYYCDKWYSKMIGSLACLDRPPKISRIHYAEYTYTRATLSFALRTLVCA